MLTWCRLLSVTHKEAMLPSLGSVWVPWGDCQQGHSSVMLPSQGLYPHVRNACVSFILLIRLIPLLLQKLFWYFPVTVESSWWSTLVWDWCLSSSLRRQVFGKCPQDSFVYSVQTHTDTHNGWTQFYLKRCFYAGQLLRVGPVGTPTSSFPNHFFVICKLS